jgi:hypothetical protein
MTWQKPNEEDQSNKSCINSSTSALEGLEAQLFDFGMCQGLMVT